MSNVYGQLDSEKMANDNKVSRQIVKEINDFGINDRQRWMIIKLLTLELENVDHMKQLTKLIDDLKANEILVSRVFSTESAPDPNKEIE